MINVVRGRPPLPIEVRRLRGRTPGTDSGGRKIEPTVRLPVIATLDAATEAPPCPEGLKERGRSLWGQVWAEGITWISPVTDMQVVVEACRLADDTDWAREQYRITGVPADMRALVAVSKSFMDALTQLGFSPVARSRLGVAEVKRASALEDLFNKRHEERS